MKITFLGAARTVTGSCFHVETEKCKFLVDCGMFQGYSKENAQNEEPFPFNPSELDFILLTHAHIDHSGRIPKIFIDGFKGDIYATKATVELCGIMLPDSGHIQEFEAEWANRKRKRAGQPPVEPLYTQQDAYDCLKLFKKVRYGEIININEGVRVRFNDAGHILGSAIIEVWTNENGEELKTVFTGDLGNTGMPILRDPTIIDSADCLVVESTYGNRKHIDTKDKTEKFVNIILDTLNKKGNVIIPSFAVGRTQEIIYDINKQHALNEPELKKLLSTPVYIDSPLAISATEIFRKNLDCYDEEAKAYIENGDNPLDFPGLFFTKTADESKALNEMDNSMIIISASGMCEAGRIKHHLKHNLWRKESTVLFVGYQAEGTLGRRLVDGAKKVRIFGEEILVNARIEMIDGFSGHADKDGLLEWMRSFKKMPERVFVVHGEYESMKDFKASIRERFNGLEVIIPSRGNSFVISPKKVAETVYITPKLFEEYRYKRLEVLDYMDKLKEELDELVEIMKTELKRGVSDEKLVQLEKRLKNVEQSFIEVLK